MKWMIWDMQSLMQFHDIKLLRNSTCDLHRNNGFSKGRAVFLWFSFHPVPVRARKRVNEEYEARIFSRTLKMHRKRNYCATNSVNRGIHRELDGTLEDYFHSRKFDCRCKLLFFLFALIFSLFSSLCLFSILPAPRRFPRRRSQLYSKQTRHG